MAHQINLYNPILLAPRRHFSARTMLQALGLLVAVLILISGWMSFSDARLRREVQQNALSQSAERDRLTQVLAARPVNNGPALEQEIAQAQQLLTRRQRLLDELGRGRIVDGRSHSAVLQMVAQTVPPSVWLNDVRVIDGRLELNGFTLQPDALRPWLGELARHPLTAAQQLAAVKLERVAPNTASTAPPSGVTVWSFQLMSKTPTPAEAAP